MESRGNPQSGILVMLFKCPRRVNIVMPISLTSCDIRMDICKFQNIAVRAINLFKNSYFTSKSEVMKALPSALILRVLKIVKKLIKNVNCLFVLLILFIIFSGLSIISITLPYWLYHQLSFLYAMCSKSSTCCLSEWAAVYMQEILFTLQRLKMFLYHHNLYYLQCLSLFMIRMFRQNKTPATLSYLLTAINHILCMYI